jgi:hypothetical protein
MIGAQIGIFLAVPNPDNALSADVGSMIRSIIPTAAPSFTLKVTTAAAGTIAIASITVPRTEELRPRRTTLLEAIVASLGGTK